MTPQQIKANAPEGATHYYDYPSSGLLIDYYKVANGFIYVWSIWAENPEWQKLSGRIHSFEIKPL